MWCRAAKEVAPWSRDALVAARDAAVDARYARAAVSYFCNARVWAERNM